MTFLKRVVMVAAAWLVAAGCGLAFGAGPAAAVVNGQPVASGQFDSVANVQIFGMGECSGVLLAPSWVITAGHCASVSGALSEGLVPSQVSIPAAAYTVYLGTPNADGSGGERHTVSEVQVDPKFLVTNGDGNDVTLLHLSTPSAQPTMQIAPDDPALWSAGVLATVAGFGTTSESSSVKPPTMRSAQVPFVTDADCASVYPFGADIVANDGWYDPNTMVCAGYAQGGTDVCEGDSGGPILAPVDGRLELIGTTSFGHGCAEPGYPTAYALAASGPIRAFLEQYVPGAFASPPAPPAATAPPRKTASKPVKKKPVKKKPVKKKPVKKKAKQKPVKQERAVTAARGSVYAPLNQPGPPLSVPVAQLKASLSCQPGVTDAKVEPVLLNPATGLTPQENYANSLEPILAAHDIPYCTYTAPDDTLGDIQTSGEYIVSAIRTMYAVAHRKIAIVGHSQGGMSMRWALRFWPDTRAMVDKVIGLAGTNDGTNDISTLPTTCTLGCAAADWEQARDSAFIQALNSDAETFAGISYTNIYTHTDEVAVPDKGAGPSDCTSCLFTGTGAITNVAIQQICPGDVDEHLLIPVDAAADALVVDALTHSAPADPSSIPSSVCSQTSGTDTNLAGYLSDIGAGGGSLGAVAAGFLSPATTGAPILDSPPAIECYAFATCTGSAAPSLRLQRIGTVRRLRAHQRALLDVRVVADEGGVFEPVPGVRVTVGGHSMITGPLGRAGIRLTFSAAGHYRVTASRAGTNSAATTVSVAR